MEISVQNTTSFIFFVLGLIGCSDIAQPNENNEVPKKNAQDAIYHPPYDIEKNILDSLDLDYGLT